ncbi:ABC transporter substrate-binding protein [Sutcliffiella sp. NPDC057660]|uniref:ABC transporter substrate-binding protein n=1 Tax=Sutcliffiella sp. NPDC057660 TaxID=3346199 RepID=UPI0036A45FB7
MSKKILLFISLLVLLSGCLKQITEVNEQKPLVIATIIPEHGEMIKNVYSKNYDNDIELKSVFPSAEKVSDHWHDLDAVIDEYMKENKDIDIIFGFPTDYLDGLVKRGNVKKLNDLIEEPILEKIAPAVIEPIKKAGNGDVYAVSPTFNNQLLIYNKKIFKELGIDKPESSMNWEEMASFADKIQSQSDYKGIALGFIESDKEFYWLSQSLMDPIQNIENENGKAVVDNEINKKYWTLFSQLYKNNLKATTEEFIKGKVAMAIIPISQLVDTEFIEFYAKIDDVEWGLVEMPVFEENKGGLAFSDSLFSISAFSENEEAVKFLEYIQGKEFAELLTQNSFLPSYWDEDIKEALIQKYGYDLTPAFNQPGALFENPQFEGKRFREIRNVGEKYFIQYLNETGELSTLLAQYENAVNQ